jgi:hypothetical protein
MLLNEGTYGGKRILSAATVREMTNPQSARCEAAKTYGLGCVLTPGRWYVSVYCATTVDTIGDPESGFHRYVGNRRILNGAAYRICVNR